MPKDKTPKASEEQVATLRQQCEHLELANIPDVEFSEPSQWHWQLRKNGTIVNIWPTKMKWALDRGETHKVLDIADIAQALGITSPETSDQPEKTMAEQPPFEPGSDLYKRESDVVTAARIVSVALNNLADAVREIADRED